MAARANGAHPRVPVPRPAGPTARRHRHRYHGVLDPHAPFRAAATARAGLPNAGPTHDAPLLAATERRDTPAAQPRPRAGYLWARLFGRIYEGRAQGWACAAEGAYRLAPWSNSYSGRGCEASIPGWPATSCRRVLACLARPLPGPGFPTLRVHSGERIAFARIEVLVPIGWRTGKVDLTGVPRLIPGPNAR